MVKQITQQLGCLCLLLLYTANTQAQITPEVSAWMLSDGTQTGHYYLTDGTLVDTGVEADVQEVWYTEEHVYVKATGMAAYNMGPFLDGNPNQPDDQNYLFRITRDPQPNTGDLVETPLGAIGVLINGVLFENYADAMSWNNEGIWNRNANFWELDGFDCARAHPQGTAYHVHQSPAAFNTIDDPETDICDMYPSEGLFVPDPSEHSPLLGYAFDGYPLYGPFAYENTDGTGQVIRMRSSYQGRDMVERNTLPDGTAVNAGPDVDAIYPIGTFKEDYEYVEGSGTLDEFNGRFCITPEYPEGIYAYFVTEDENGHSHYPFLVGPHYYGIVDDCNFTIGEGGPGGGPGGMEPAPCDEVPPGMPCCGDGICDGPETEENCPEDCGDGGGTGGTGGGYSACDVEVPEEALQFTGITDGITELNTTPFVSLSPNPASTTVELRFTATDIQQMTYTIYDVSGAIRITDKYATVSGDLNISIENLPAGIYLLECKTADRLYSSKFVKK